MSWPAFSVPAPAFAGFKDATQTILIVFILYLVGAETAFLIGTLSDKIFAPLWPPNVVLLGAMLMMGRERIWLCILAALPAHIIAETSVRMPLLPMAVAFATNVAVAGGSAAIIWRLIGEPPWFGTFRNATLYVAMVAFIVPAIVAFAGAFVPMLSGAPGTYDVFWLQWFAANVLGNLTLGPIAVILAGQGAGAFWPATRARQIEALVLIVVVVVVTHVAFVASAGHASNLFLPSLLYTPLPIILWFVARFGAVGASLSIVTVTVDLIWRALNGPSVFLAGTPDTNVFALQVFVVCLAVPILLLGASIDRTQQIEGKLREDEERIGLAAAAANVGFWQYDSAARTFWLSDHARLLFGQAEDGPVVADKLLAAVHPDDVHLVREIIFERETDGADRTAEFRVGPPGQTRWISARLQKPGESPASQTSGIFIDVTARKASEAESEQQRRELAHLMRVSQVGELSGGLAHEITQPLTAILANAQAARLMLEASPPDLTVIAEVLEDIIREDQRAGEVISRLRSLLKDTETRSEEIDLNGLVESTLQLLRNELVSRRVKVERDLDPAIPVVFGDQIQLQQVLLNLVMNAIEAVHQMATPRRVILLRSRHCSDNTVEISVVDRGAGISPAHEMRIFEPFFTTKERGIGLGLSICSTIVTRHRGTLTLENNSDGGATASMRVPLERRSGGRI